VLQTVCGKKKTKKNNCKHTTPLTSNWDSKKKLFKIIYELFKQFVLKTVSVQVLVLIVTETVGKHRFDSNIHFKRIVSYGVSKHMSH